DDRAELYHLPSDPGEQTDLASKEPTRTARMQQALLDWLREQHASFPQPDPAFDPAKRSEVLARYRDKLLPSLEARRKARYAPDWQPNEEWWGSSVTPD
ncbi:MAG: sulfatase, partial [Bacteroidota bacterium]